jgi:hypothetical protein
LLLVTISNLGAQVGTVTVNLSDGSSFSLMPAPGANLNLNRYRSAVIPAGGHLTFGVTFQPKLAGATLERQSLLLFGPGGVSFMALEGLGVPDNTGGTVPPMVAPITPQLSLLSRLSRARPMRKVAAVPWLLGTVLVGGLLTVGRARLRRRSEKRKSEM